MSCLLLTFEGVTHSYRPRWLLPSLLALLISPTIAACSGGGEDGAQPPAGWDDGVRLAPAVNSSRTPGVVEIALDARVASLAIRPDATGPTPAWTYGGSIPGPLIRAHVGDRLIVHFTNNLPEETTIHWHGIRLPADQDGVPGHSQAAVPPGGSFDYSFTLPDAGLFWYHPHLDSAVQVGDGLYGALLVEESAAVAAADAAVFGAQTVLVLSDIGINDDGSFNDPDGGGDIGTLFGREGQTLLVNGRVQPTLLARPGQRQRWRVVNSSKSRYYQLAAAGQTFTRIGGDGGLLAAPITSERVLLIPGERADLLITPQGQVGDVVQVRWVAYNRGFGTDFNRPDENVLALKLVAGDVPPPAELPARLRTIAPLDTAGATERDIELTQSTVDGRLVLGINGIPASAAVPLHASANQTDVWTITNNMDFDHPFHLHGFFFQPLDAETGAALPAPEWKDTFNVPQHGSSKMVVKYDDRRGMWMFHCHILDHAEAGMMGMLHLD